MKMRKNIYRYFFCLFLTILFFFPIISAGISNTPEENQSLDDRVRNFLDSHRYSWRDMNVPSSDGKILYDLIIKNNYKKALEIGTSTGHSGIWIAWALSKTGGKLITIEIDEDRYREAVANFEDAGLSEYIDARLADAHKLVKELKGPFDFVFSDADKGWYKNYFIDVYPKLEVGGCFTAHNISDRSRRRGRRSGRRSGTAEFYDYVRSLSNMETTLNSSGNGISISYKKSEE
jgi:predicted O-methyltransferase YrrM